MAYANFISVQPLPAVFSYDFEPADREKFDFAAGLEEVLAHLWALKTGLEDGDARPAAIHAERPARGPYDAMRPALASYPRLSHTVETALAGLPERTGTGEHRLTALHAVNEARSVMENARRTVLGEAVSADPAFKMMLVKALLDASTSEYRGAFGGGVTEDNAGLQASLALALRSQQMFHETRDEMNQWTADRIDIIYDDLLDAHDGGAAPYEVNSVAERIAYELDVQLQKRLDYAIALDEMLVHLWDLEIKLDEGDERLASIHASHRLQGPYNIIKHAPAWDPDLRRALAVVLDNLRYSASADVSRPQAQMAINDAKSVVRDVSATIVGEALGKDPKFRMAIMKALLEKSAAEHRGHVGGNATIDASGFRDGFAFVLRSQQMFHETRDEMNPRTADRIDVIYAGLLDAYDEGEDPSKAASLTGGIVDELDGLLGIEVGGESDPPVSANSIIELLDDAGAEYRDGNAYLAASYATRAYADYDKLLAQSMADGGWSGKGHHRAVVALGNLASMMEAGASESQVAERLDTVMKMLNRMSDAVSEPGVAGLDTGDCKHPRALLIKAGSEKLGCVTRQTAEKLIERGWGVLHGESELSHIEVNFALSSYGYVEEMDAFLVSPLVRPATTYFSDANDDFYDLMYKCVAKVPGVGPCEITWKNGTRSSAHDLYDVADLVGR